MRLGVLRLRYILCLCGILIALQPSYIHPDEHFQSLEVVASQTLGIKGTIPWEFERHNAARSFAAIDLFYAPVFLVLRHLFRVQDPMIILWVVRLQHCLLYLLISNWSLNYLLGANSSDNRSLRGLYILISYITWCYQSHSFSNSVETLILLVVLGLFQSCLQSPELDNYKTSLLLGFFISLGIFNRMTFPVFILFPSLRMFYSYFLRQRRSFVVLLLSFTVFSLLFILIDTQIYESSNFIIAPWNNLKYNLSVSNLSEHGLHRWYTHILVNLPQMFGPSLLFFIKNGKNVCTKTHLTSLPFLSIMSSLVVLSMFQHQELRFLIPLVPLFYTILPLNKFRILFKIWCIYNVIMCLVLGIFHQSGVIKSILNQSNLDSGVAIWWKTYSPPTWMYMNPNLEVASTNFVDGIEKVDNVDFSKTKNYVVDLKGSSTDLLNYTLTRFFMKNPETTVYLTTPNSMQSELKALINDSRPSFVFSEIYHSFIHLDLDHLDPYDLTTFVPGIYVWKVQYSEGNK